MSAPVAVPTETTEHRPGPALTARSALLLACWFGLIGGAFDLALIFLNRDVFHASLYYEQGRHFLWVVPLANLALVLAPGLFLAALAALRSPRRVGNPSLTASGPLPPGGGGLGRGGQEWPPDQAGAVRSERGLPLSPSLPHQGGGGKTDPGRAVPSGPKPGGGIPLRPAAWLLATLALWGPLLRVPIYGAASLVVAAGLGRWISRLMEARAGAFSRLVPWTAAALGLVVTVTAALSLANESRAEKAALARLPAAPAGARNVLLLVMDTVRADSLSLHGYARPTSPNLERWAGRGIKFDRAFSPAPWTFPSHACFLTGRWPSELGAHWKPTLDTPDPTLAESLAARGYRTAGFAANTHWCSYESRLDRGFAHYEDYPLTAWNALASTRPGRWVLSTLLNRRGEYGRKWIKAQSRDAREVNEAFLAWLDRPSGGRPFFAFLNYLDAHDPFLPPPDAPRFGLRPASRADGRMLLEYWDRDKSRLTPRDVQLARDSYDDCIAALDRRVGALLDDLERRGLLRDTAVIITSDHGEQFGEHGVFNHGFSLYAHEVHVPLIVLAPGLAAGRTVARPVTLRDIPATVADLLEIADSPLPGHSLASSWREPESPPGTSPPVSEVDIPREIIPQWGRGPKQRGFTLGVVEGALHHILDLNSAEELFDLGADPAELRDLRDDPAHLADLRRARQALRRALADRPAPPGVAGQALGRFGALLNSMLP